MGSNSLNSIQQQYCLKWNNHQTNLLKVFNRLLSSEQFTDVLLAAEGKTLRGHKVVLSACSSYFEQLFSSFNEKNQIVILKDTKFDDLAAIIEFMYKGEISIIQEQLSSLLKTAESLKVKGLAEVSGDEKTSSPTSSSTSTPPSNAAHHNKSSNPSSSVVEIAPKSNSPRVNSNNNNHHHHHHHNALSSSYSSSCSSSSNSSTSTSSAKASSLSNEHHQTHSQQQRFPPPKLHESPRDSLSPPPHGTTPAKKRGRPRLSELREQTKTYYKKRCSDSSSSSSSNNKSESLLNNKVESLIRSVEDGMAEEELIKTEQLSYINEDGAPTPGGPLTMERIQDLGVIKMNDYLMSGTRQQFWDEYFIKVVMQGVRNKEIDMKSAAEILGVSYGTLYGRYRETFGYLKHAWNVGGRPPKIPSGSPGSKDLGLMTMWTDPQNEEVLEQLKQGRITIKQAADMLGMEPSVLDYHLTGKTGKMYMDEEDELMEVQPDIILRQEDTDPIEIEED